MVSASVNASCNNYSIYSNKHMLRIYYVLDSVLSLEREGTVWYCFKGKSLEYNVPWGHGSSVALADTIPEA